MDVEIIIVNWNTKELLDNCIASVLKHCNTTVFSYTITIVDNASEDGSAEMVKSKYRDLKLIVNNSNLGFAKANNRAIQESTAKYVLLLNSDTVLNNDIISPVCQHFNQNEKLAIAGCCLILPNGTRQVGDAGYRLCLRTAFNFAFFLSRLFPEYFHGLFHNGKTSGDYVEVDWVSGAALFADMDFIKKYGPLAEDFFMYAEDVEWGLRAINNGWHVHYLPNIKVNHLYGASLKNDGISTTSLENLHEFIKKDQKAFVVILFWIIMTCGYTLRYFIQIGLSLFKSNNPKKEMMKVYTQKCFDLIFNVKL